MRRLLDFSSIIAILVCPALAQSHTAADLGHAIVTAGLDPSACYRVRDVEISKDDVQFYLTDGYIIFGKPVNGAPVAAVFTADVASGDAEVLLIPPDRSERKALSTWTNSPTLDEHFRNAIFFFTDAEARGLADRIRTKGEAKPSPEAGALLSDQWSAALGNLAGSFESRIVLDLLDDSPGRTGFIEAVVQGNTLGNFDVTYDSRAPEQISAGKLNTRDGATYWDVWTSFTARMRRGLPPSLPDEELLNYRIEATLDDSLKLHCVTRIHLRVTPGSSHALPFDLSSQMRATGAMVDGVPAEVYSRESVRTGEIRNNGNELLLVIPPQPLAPGSEHDIEIHHEGSVVVDAGHQVYLVSSRGTWYPNLGWQFARYDVTWKYPKLYDLVSAGQVKEDRIEGDTHITRRVPDGRLDILGFNLGQYTKKSVQKNNVEIVVNVNPEVERALRPLQTLPNVHDDPPVLPGRRRGLIGTELNGIKPDDPIESSRPVSPEMQLEKVADEIAAAMDFFRVRFGDPPLSRIEVSPLRGRFGQGFAGMIYLPIVSYLPATVRPLSLMPAWQQAFYSGLLRAHEAAHQWWGNIITTTGYHHEWLTEALANYSAVLFLENRYGSKLVDNLLDEYRRELLAKGPDGETTESEGPIVDGRRLESSNNPSAWNAVAYGKGTWILHMLRRRMGDAQFMKMLGELRRRYEWKAIDTDQFRLLCAEFLPKGSRDPKLENFFDQWVYGTGVPALKLNYSVKGKPGALRLSGTVTQSGVSSDFSVAVPIEIQTGRGKVVREVMTAEDPVAFSVPVTIANAKAVLDPGQSVLRR